MRALKLCGRSGLYLAGFNFLLKMYATIPAPSAAPMPM
jgi:hypothetical protein